MKKKKRITKQQKRAGKIRSQLSRDMEVKPNYRMVQHFCF